MKILLIGSGGREHALAWKLAQSPQVQTVYVAPGNGGTATAKQATAGIENLPITGLQELADFAKREKIHLTVVGPEAPLAAGIVDVFRNNGLRIFGPTQLAAQLESSKDFSKAFMKRHGIPTAEYQTFSNALEAHAYIDAKGAPIVIKADGLAAGKGVIVTNDRDAALAHAEKFMDIGILVEEFLAGQEVSLFFLADGKTVVPLSPAQDFKRAYDNDEGPNTGGMGAYSPLPWLPEGFVEEVQRDVAQPTVDEMAKLGTPFIGLLYCGLIVTERGIRVIEFNARFGDPETQVVLRRLTSSLSGLLYKAATGQLNGATAPDFTKDVAITVVLASEGYPDTSAPNRPIYGLSEAEETGIEICHAATAFQETRTGEEVLVSTGGRVLSVVATGTDFASARKQAYAGIEKIQLEGSHYRKDIAAKVAN